jgi:hypothetical protein
MNYKILFFIGLLILILIFIYKCFNYNKINLIETFESEKFPPIQKFNNVLIMYLHMMNVIKLLI